MSAAHGAHAEGSLQAHSECTVIRGRQHVPVLIVAASWASVSLLFPEPPVLAAQGSLESHMK